MAKDVMAAPGAVEPVEAGPRTYEPSRAERARHSAYRNRFVLIYLGLAVVVGCALGALIVGLTDPKSKSPIRQTLPFRPAASGEIGAMDLAAQVQRQYLLEDGNPIVDVIATRNTLQNGNLGFLRVRFQVIQPLDAAKGRDQRILTTNDAVQFSLCGNGASCAIPGTPTAQRLTMLRREALELGLRSLVNDAALDSVAVFLGPVPPPQGSSMEGYVLVFNRAVIAHNDAGLLTKPIAQTLPGAGSTITPNQVSAEDVLKIKDLTKPYLYLYRYQIVGGRDAVLDLQPVDA